MLSAITILFTSNCFSQADFRKGFIVTNKRDTVFGLVDYREGSKAYRSCDFRESMSQDINTYEPLEISGYGFINDKLLEKREIKIEDQPARFVFVEVIIRGLVSLYEYEDYYFTSKNGSYLECITGKSKVVYVDEKQILKKSDLHVAILNTQLADCSRLKERIQNTSLRKRSLINLIKDYNDCIGRPSIIYKNSKPWIKASIGVTGGLNISTIHFKSSEANTYDHLTKTFNPSHSSITGISWSLLSPRNSEYFSIRGDILYTSTKHYSFNQNDNFSYFEKNYVTIKLKELKIPISFQYTFPKKWLTPYFNIGVSNVFHLHSSSNWIRESEWKSTQVVETTESAALKIVKSQVGLLAGLGLVKSLNSKLNIFMELRFERTSGLPVKSLQSTAGVGSNITNIQFTLGFRTK